LISFIRPWALRVGLVLLALAWVSAIPARAQAEISREYQIKALFLFNFAQFVQWPSAAFTRTNEPFRIGILGDDPFDGFLDETVRGEKINGHPLVIERYADGGDVKDCQILFVGRSESGRMGAILDAVRGKNILNVGDMEGFLKNGGIIRFVTEENKIHFRIDLDAAKSVNLVISSKVLRLAEIVEPGKD
jgi:hypothetical protein